MCLKVAPKDGGGVWELGRESVDVVANVAESGDRVMVVSRRKVRAYEQGRGSARGADEEGGDARGEAGGSRREFADVGGKWGGGFVGN